MYVWSHGQSISHKVYKKKYLVHFDNIQLGQVIYTPNLRYEPEQWDENSTTNLIKKYCL